MLERDLRLVALTGARYHAALVSNRLSLEAMRRAREAGLAATCGVSINNLTLNELDVGDYRTFLKLNPPLRGEDERMALVEALDDGADRRHLLGPRSAGRRDQAPAVRGGRGRRDRPRDDAVGEPAPRHRGPPEPAAPPPRDDAAAGGNPAACRSAGSRSARRPTSSASIPDEPYVLDPADLHSRCRNTPFDEARLEGRVKLTLVAGRVAHE